AISGSVILNHIGQPALSALWQACAKEELSGAARLAAVHVALRIDSAASRERPEILGGIPILIRLLGGAPRGQRAPAAEARKNIAPAARDALPVLRKRLELPADGVDTQGISRDYVRRTAEEAIAKI